MRRLATLCALLALAIGPVAEAASTTPPNLTPATSVANGDLLLVWPTASVGPLEALSWANLKTQLNTDLTGFLKTTNNLSDIANVTTARVNLGVTATGADTTYAFRSNNLSDLASATTARTNLGVPTGTSGAVLPFLNGNNTWSGVQTFNDSTLLLKGSTSGTLLIRCAPTCGSGTLILPAGSTNFSGTGGTSQVVKQTTAGGAFTVGRLACADLSDSGTGCSSSASAVTGSLTPTLAYETPGTSSFSYSTQGGSYVCANSVVTGWARITFTPTNGTASGNLYWSNPPYAPVNATISPDVQFGPPAFFSSSGWASLSTLSYGPALNAGTHIVFDNLSGSTVTTISTANSTTATAKTLSFYFTYLTASSC